MKAADTTYVAWLHVNLRAPCMQPEEDDADLRVDAKIELLDLFIADNRL